MRIHRLITAFSAASSQAATFVGLAGVPADETNDFVKILIITDLEPDGLGSPATEVNIQVRVGVGNILSKPGDFTASLADQFLHTAISSSSNDWNGVGWTATATGSFSMLIVVPRYPFMGLAVAASAASPITIEEGWIIE